VRDEFKLRRKDVVGITSIGTYTPVYRLARSDIAGTWKTMDYGGERSVARHDEDSLTMAVDAVLKCLHLSPGVSDGVFFASTTPPYREKQTAALLSAAVDLAAETSTNDFTDSVRSGTIAMAQAMDAVNSGSAKQVVVTASDCRMSVGKSDNEQLIGDGAAAITIGSRQVIAAIEGRYSIYSEFTGAWRHESSAFTKTWENRFATGEGYIKTMQEAITRALQKQQLGVQSFAKAIFNGPDQRSHVVLAKKLGFDLKSQVQDSLMLSIGNTGTPAVFLMLAEVFETARPGELMLLANYGDGVDVFVLRVTDAIRTFQKKANEFKRIQKKIQIDYQTYLTWRNLIVYEEPRHPENERTSIPCSWREQKSILPFYGSRCSACGAVQYPPQRVCTQCQSKDTFKEYKLSDKTGHIFTYAIDQLNWGKERPLCVGVVDFEGGGRFMSEICDCNPDEVSIGMPVEMCFRKLNPNDEFEKYFWKVRPV
jgi:3-hydroxy-3-methylglutaryl CoA synthase